MKNHNKKKGVRPFPLGWNPIEASGLKELQPITKIDDSELKFFIDV